MVHPAQKLHSDFAGDEPPASEERLRKKLKAHLNWCAYLGRSIDGETLPDLVAMLRQTAATMQDLAEQAEKQQR